MEHFINSLYKVPLDVWYFVAIISGSIAYGAFTEAKSVKQSFNGFLLGVFGGGVSALLATAYLSLPGRAMIAIVALTGFFGNWLLHWVYEKRNLASAIADAVIKARFNVDNKPKQTDSEGGQTKE